MKKIVFVLSIVLVFLLAFGCVQESGYRLVSSGEVNRADFRHDISVSQSKEQYIKDGFYYTVEILEYSSDNDASEGFARIIEQYNPAQVTLGGKYIKVKEFPIVDESGNVQGTGSALYFYQSANQIVVIDATRENGGDAFVEWYFGKHLPN